MALWGGLTLALGVTGALVAQQERTLAAGRVVLLALAPVDPRSLMQGDYMRLAYAVAGEAVDASQAAGRPLPDEGRIVLQLDEGGIGHFARLHEPGAPLGADEALLRYRLLEGRVVLGAETFFFPEGQAERYAGARYAELRVDAAGDAVLVGLRGPAREALP
jgi:uncharacterized membrane-anchored protein